MQSITKQFAATGVSSELFVKKGQSMLYRVDLSADWDGTVILRKTTNGGITYTTVAMPTTDITGSIIKAEEDAAYSFRCTAFTAGTADVTMNDLEATGTAREGAGTVPITTVTADEAFDGVAVRKTVLRLSSVPVSVVSVTTGAGVGGTKIYDFPSGRILMLGCMADLSLQIAAADQAAFTDATPEGDIGIGTVAPANADALGTDATDDDFATAAAFTMDAYADASVQCPSENSIQKDGTSTAIDMYLNMLVDAADIDDDTTSTVYASGLVTFVWINLGDF